MEISQFQILLLTSIVSTCQIFLGTLKTPKMLWKKQESPNSSSYIDIFAAINPDVPLTKLYMAKYEEMSARDYENRASRFEYQKNEFLATSRREAGKKLYAERKYVEAMQEFNITLLSAPRWSDEIGLAYANRSACFFQLNMFQECLADIKMAKRSNYPVHLMNKLDARASKCEALKGANVKSVLFSPCKPSLSFEEHDKFAGVANCLEIRKNDEFGRHVVATSDLKIGQTILIEQPFSIVPQKCCGNYFDRCFHCFGKLKNFITCENCITGFYCNEDCMRNDFHETGCNIGNISCKNKFGLVVKTFINIIDAFPDVDVLMSTVDGLLKGDDLADGLTAAQNDFCALFQLTLNHHKYSDQQSKDLRSESTAAYMAITPFACFKEKFVTTEHRCFAQHLVLHLFHIAEHAIDLHEDTREDDTMTLAEFCSHHYATAMYAFGSYINHSCIPNICWFFVDNRLICKVIRPIKKGEQVFRSYL